MQILIKCDCGNEVYISAKTGKCTQLRDCLDRNKFHFSPVESKSGALKELQIQCNVCKQWITLGVD